MSDRARAEEDLRVIRSLMERATIYRAISAPTAFVAGVLSILSAGLIYLNNDVNLIFGRPVGPREFAISGSMCSFSSQSRMASLSGGKPSPAAARLSLPE